MLQGQGERWWNRLRSPQRAVWEASSFTLPPANKTHPLPLIICSLHPWPSRNDWHQWGVLFSKCICPLPSLTYSSLGGAEAVPVASLGVSKGTQLHLPGPAGFCHSPAMWASERLSHLSGPEKRQGPYGCSGKGSTDLS